MIEKMKFLSITGPKTDIDRVTTQYLSKYEIHLENALSELKTVSNLRPFTENNPYRRELQKAVDMLAVFPEDFSDFPDCGMGLEESLDVIHTLEGELDQLSTQKESCQKQLENLQNSKKNIVPFFDLNYDVRSILHFEYIRFRFGRMPHEYYDKFMNYIYDTVDTVLHKCQDDKEYVWVVYFVPEICSDKVDAIYASMHFERFFLADEYEGTPTEALHILEEKMEELSKQILEIGNQMAQTTQRQKERLAAAYAALRTYSDSFNIRKMAACTKQEGHTFYIICGWMSETDAASFRDAIKDDTDTFCFVEDDHGNIMSKPPTKLKNPKIFQPFEMFIKMYGLPSYNEIDPTILLGLSYSFLFGFMFGDVGQGLLLTIGGYLLYRAKKMSLAAIISCCGVFSTLFGFLFGSVFGFENVIRPLWLHPKSAMTALPFIGNLNTVFIVAIVLGMGIILLTMVCNVINSIRFHDSERAYFDTNGVAGIVFYGAIVVTVFLYMTSNPLPATMLLVLLFVLPLLAIFFKEPLMALVEKKAQIMPKEKGMFFVQGVFELFEILLSYFSNTLSFVRVGAFAVSHAAMMEVVLMLANAEAGSPNWLIIIIGNLFVCGMEGLIVGIQVLRLEYYELFSRFYHGTGRAFKPYGKNENQI